VQENYLRGVSLSAPFFHPPDFSLVPYTTTCATPAASAAVSISPSLLLFYSSTPSPTSRCFVSILPLRLFYFLRRSLQRMQYNLITLPSLHSNLVIILSNRFCFIFLSLSLFDSICPSSSHDSQAQPQPTKLICILTRHMHSPRPAASLAQSLSVLCLFSLPARPRVRIRCMCFRICSPDPGLFFFLCLWSYSCSLCPVFLASVICTPATVDICLSNSVSLSCPSEVAVAPPPSLSSYHADTSYMLQ